MRLYILPYKSSSNSAKLLASSLNCKRIKCERSRFRHTLRTLVINWGSSSPHPNVDSNRLLNKFDSVGIAINKLKTFQKLTEANVPCLTWTTDKEVAASWNSRVYVRHLLESSQGNGIQICRRGEELPDAPLYTRGAKTSKEYRLHVGRHNGVYELIHTQQKRLREDAPEDRVIGIRNTANGWVFACNNVDSLSTEQIEVAFRAAKALDLDFCGIDLIINSNNQVLVCEVNTAPGLEGTTLTQYTQFFRKHLNGNL